MHVPVRDLSQRKAIGLHMNMKPKQAHIKKTSSTPTVVQLAIANHLDGKRRMYRSKIDTFDRQSDIEYMDTLT